MKLLTIDLKSGSFPPHHTSTYTCRVTIAPRVHSGVVNYY